MSFKYDWETLVDRAEHLRQEEKEKVMFTNDAGVSYLDEIFKKMRIIEVKTGKPVKLTLYSDGSGTVAFDDSERMFSTPEMACGRLRQLETAGYMS